MRKGVSVARTGLALGLVLSALTRGHAAEGAYTVLDAETLADMRCAYGYLYAMDFNDTEAYLNALLSSAYFRGRVEARHPAFDWNAAIAANPEALTLTAMGAAADSCYTKMEASNDSYGDLLDRFFDAAQAAQSNAAPQPPQPVIIAPDGLLPPQQNQAVGSDGTLRQGPVIAP
jgi:hypothetical protein